MSVHLTVSITAIYNLISRSINTKGLASDPIFQALNKTIHAHQNMIEETYRSCLLTCKEYLEMGKYTNAANVLMEPSNRHATPIINYILGCILIKTGSTALGKNKLQKAFMMNPFLFINENDNLTGLLIEPQAVINSWSTIPYVVKDSFGNKVFRKLGDKVDEGITEFQISTMGGDIAFCLRANDMEMTQYGVISISDGTLLWSQIVKEEFYKKIILSSPEYVVFKDDSNMFFICDSNNGNLLATFSQSTFESVFCPANTLDKIQKSDYLVWSGLPDDESSVINIPLIHDTSRSVSVHSQIVKEHEYPVANKYRGINGYVKYYAKQVIISI